MMTMKIMAILITMAVKQNPNVVNDNDDAAYDNDDHIQNVAYSWLHLIGLIM